jgi:hypothetical protein
MFTFLSFHKTSLIKSCSSFEGLSAYKISWPNLLVQVLQPPLKFEGPPFWNGWSREIKKFGVKVIFNGMTFLPNFIEANQ